MIFSQRNIFMQRTDQEQTTQTALFSVNTVTPPSITRWREQVRAGTFINQVHVHSDQVSVRCR